MQLISDIINDLVSNQISLTVALNKTKVLATRIGNTGLLEWVNLELTGYQDDELIPSYRKTNGTVKGDFINGMQRGSNFPIQLEVGDENNRKLREFKFSQGIAILEGFLISSKKGTLLYQYPESLMRSIQGLLQNTNGPYFQLTRIGVEVPANFATEVISVVKSKLLDFILTLETEFGIETEINDLKKNNKKVTYIMNNTINTSGDGNVITTGEKAIVTATINITKGNNNSSRH